MPRIERLLQNTCKDAVDSPRFRNSGELSSTLL
jgi:hypothetical protein